MKIQGSPAAHDAASEACPFPLSAGFDQLQEKETHDWADSAFYQQKLKTVEKYHMYLIHQVPCHSLQLPAVLTPFADDHFPHAL